MLVAAIHFRPIHRAPAEENAHRLFQLIGEAVERKASLVVAPELALSGFAYATPDEMRPFAVAAESEGGNFAESLGAFAFSYIATIVAGVAERDPSGKWLYNSALVADSSAIVEAVSAPRLPHNYGWVTGFGSGDADLFQLTRLGRLRVALCAGLLMLPDGPPAGIIAVPASWNDDPPGTCLPLWQSIARQRNAALIIANRHGREQYSTGHIADFSQAVSCIIAPDGSILARSSPGQHDEILYAELPEPE